MNSSLSDALILKVSRFGAALIGTKSLTGSARFPNKEPSSASCTSGCQIATITSGLANQVIIRTGQPVAGQHL